jgi:hypothetical protein
MKHRCGRYEAYARCALMGGCGSASSSSGLLSLSTGSYWRSAYSAQVSRVEHGLVEDPEQLLHLFLASSDHTIHALNCKLVSRSIYADNGEAFESGSTHPASFDLRREAVDIDHLFLVVLVLLRRLLTVHYNDSNDLLLPTTQA